MPRQALKYSRLKLDRTAFVKPQKRIFTSYKIFLFDQFFFCLFAKVFHHFSSFLIAPARKFRHFYFFLTPCRRRRHNSRVFPRASSRIFVLLLFQKKTRWIKSSENKTIELRRQKSRQFRIQMSSQSLSSLGSRSPRICVVCNTAVCPSSRRTARATVASPIQFLLSSPDCRYVFTAKHEIYCVQQEHKCY